MEFKQTKTQLIISDEEFDILLQASKIFNQLMRDMEDEDFSLIVTDNFDIDFEFLDNTTSILDALTNSNKLEVE